MAWGTVRAGTAVNGNNVSPLFPGLPASMTADELMLAVGTYREGTGTNIDFSTGWTEKFEVADTANETRIAVGWRRFVDAGDAPTITFTGGGTGDTTMARVFAFPGAIASGDPFDVVPAAGSWNVSQQNIGPIAGITPLVNDAMIVVIGHKADDCTGVDVLTGDGLTWTEASEHTTLDGSDATTVVDYAPITGAPITITSKTFTVTGGVAQTGGGIMFSLKPEPDAAPSLPPSLVMAPKATS